MLFQFLKNLLMILPQSPCYRILRDRLVSVALFRKSTIPAQPKKSHAEKYAKKIPAESKSFVERAISVRSLHCKAAWQTIRQESLEDQKTRKFTLTDEGADRRDWLGYASKQDQLDAESTLKSQNTRSAFIEDAENKYHELDPHSSRD